jgi:NAD(P)-dependent dehydrogenase (short-subunit alcohol dehydrogenase family)
MRHVAVCAGAATRTGQVVASRLAADGRSVLCVDPDGHGAMATREALEGGPHSALANDLRDSAGARLTLERAGDLGNCVDRAVWVSEECVSKATGVGVGDHEGWMEAQSRAAFFFGTETARYMQAAGGGRIVFAVGFWGLQRTLPERTTAEVVAATAAMTAQVIARDFGTPAVTAYAVVAKGEGGSAEDIASVVDLLTNDEVHFPSGTTMEL